MNKNFCCIFFLQFLAIKTLDSYPHPDSLETPDPDPQLCISGLKRPKILYTKQRTCEIRGSFVGLRPVLWIRISMDLHSIFCPGFGSVPGMRIRIQEHGNCHKFTNKPGFLPSKKKLLYLRGYVFLPITLFKYICHVKIQLFVTLQSD